MPYNIVEVEITQPLPTLSISASETGIAILLRQKDRPIAFLMKELPANSTLTPENLSQVISQEVESQLSEGDPSEPVLSDPLEGLSSLTVVICTKDNPQDLSNCLKHLLTFHSVGPDGDFELLVVDNSPSTERTRELVTSLPGARYVREPKPGLNFARNRALQEATGEVIAFIDDDVIIDRCWLSGLAKAMANHPDVAAVTGLVLPSELLTEAQILFERNGGFEKSFKTICFGKSLPGLSFYPCVGGKFGTGCNMAFLRRVLLELGGFDEALDTGAVLPGGGDSDMFFRVVRAGYPLVYEPQFMVFHRHRREFEQLRRQYCRSWGQGLMAFVFKTYRTDVAQRANLRRLVLWWFGSHIRDLGRSLRGDHVLPPEMLLAEIWGGLVGLLWAYPRSLKRVERIRKQNW